MPSAQAGLAKRPSLITAHKPISDPIPLLQNGSEPLLPNLEEDWVAIKLLLTEQQDESFRPGNYALNPPSHTSGRSIYSICVEIVVEAWHDECLPVSAQW